MKYVGSRYIPKFIDDPHDPNFPYEALSVVDGGMGVSYINDRPIPANQNIPLTDTNYWHIYGTTNGAIINLQNQIGDISDLETNTQDDLVSAINEVNSKIALADKQFLFVGDSYGDQTNEWADLVMNLIPAGHASNLCVGGAAFYSATPAYKFITQIENYIGDKDKITDIVVCGGLNDSNSSSTAAYSDVVAAMYAFDTYVRTNYPNAKVSLGYIGNGNDYAPGSQISGRTFECRQCCRYIYYATASDLGWTVLHNVEYALSGSASFIDSDGVHPTLSGSASLKQCILQAINSGSAEFNYPLFDMNATGSWATITSGDIKYRIHNEDGEIEIASLGMQIASGSSITSATAVDLATFTGIVFNSPVDVIALARFYNVDLNGTPTTNYLYVPVRLTFQYNKVMMTMLSADGSNLDTINVSSTGYLALERIIIPFNSMKTA